MADSSVPGAVPAPAPWTGIDAAPEQPGARPAAGAPASESAEPTARVARLRRQARPAVGSFDQGGMLLQRHAREAILGTAVVLVPVVALNVVASDAAFARTDRLADLVVSVPELIGGAEAATGAQTLVGYVALITNSFAVALAGGYLAQLVLRRSAGLPLGIRATWRQTLRRIPALAVAWLLGHSWALLLSLLLVQVSATELAQGAVLLVPMVAWLTSLTVLVSPTIVVERLGPVAGLRRAVRLARRRLGVMFSFVVVCTVVAGGLRVAIGALPALIESSGLFGLGSARGLADGMAAQVGQLLVVPLVGLATAWLYLQVRMDAEGMDLLLECDTAFP